MQQNSITLVGALSTDVAATTTQDGQRVARFRLALHSRRWDRATDCWVSSPPTFVEIVCRRRLAENVAVSLRRGDPVVVTGRLQVRQAAQNGRRFTRVVVDAATVGPDLARTTSVPTRRHRDAA
jgi:single-strand DNA-binding protein